MNETSTCEALQLEINSLRRRLAEAEEERADFQRGCWEWAFAATQRDGRRVLPALAQVEGLKAQVVSLQEELAAEREALAHGLASFALAFGREARRAAASR